MLLQGLHALFAMFYRVFWKSVNPGFYFDCEAQLWPDGFLIY